MSTRAPTISLKFDDGSGTYPINLTSRLNQNSISYQPYGRADENTTAGTNTLSIRLNNNDGALSSGGSQISVGQGVRLTYTVGATTVDQFTGRVQAAQVAWQGGPGKRADLMITAVDLTAELSRRPMRSMVEQEILLDGPTAYYTLSEAEGSTSAGDTSGGQKPPLVEEGSGTAVSFGTGIGPTDGLVAAQFFGGKHLRGTSPGTPYVPAGSAHTVELFFSTTTVPTTFAEMFVLPFPGSSYNVANMQMLSTGQADVGVATTPSSVADGLDHHLVATFDGTTAKGYLDGVLIGSSAAGVPPSDGTDIYLGADNDPLLPLSFTGVISHLAIYNTALSAGRVASHASVLSSFSETTDARLSRIASYLGRTATTSAPSGQVMGPQSTSGQSFLSAMEAVSEAEGGVLFIDGSGAIRMQGRYYRSLQTTAAFSLTGRDVDPLTPPSIDDTQLINKATVTRVGGAEQVVVNQASIDSIGEYPEPLELAVDTDEHALGRAQWDVAKHASPGPRMASVTFNMLVGPNRETILGAKIGDRVALSAMPSQQFAGLADLTIEGWSDSLSISGSGDPSWKRTVNFLPWELARAWVLGDATYGVLGSTTLLGY